MSQGAEWIAAERRRQVEVEGWSDRHDDGHEDGGLAIAAAELATAHTDATVGHPDIDGDEWGLVRKHRGDPVRALVIAGALIAAEIDRLMRLRRRG